MKYLKQDIVSSLVVFVVALPLSLGIAIASGVPPQMALLSAIVGGIVAGMFTGAPLTVTGPAAGLAALILQIVQEQGLQSLAAITLFCGIFQLLMSVMRSGKWFDRFPEVIIQGMLSAIGVAILIGQLHILAGHKIPGNPLQSLMGLGSTYSSPHMIALTAGIISILAIMGWTKWIPQKFKWIPGALPAVIVTTLIMMSFELPRVEITPLIPFVREQMGIWNFDYFSSMMSYPIILSGLGLAVVASAESLLTAKAGDQLAAASKKANLNQELGAQGVTNLVAGLLGGMPVTSVIVRTAANINAGAKTRFSTIFHGLWIALFVIFLPQILETIPLTVLSAVLIVTGIKLLSIPYWKKQFQNHKVDFFYGASTLVLIISTDLLKGLIAGVAIYIISEKIRKTSSHNTELRHQKPVQQN